MPCVAWALTDTKTKENSEDWLHANNVCHHTILNTLFNKLFNVYCSYKEAKAIWDSMIPKYIAGDTRNQKVMIGNHYVPLEMNEEKDIKAFIKEFIGKSKSKKTLCYKRSLLLDY